MNILTWISKHKIEIALIIGSILLIIGVVVYNLPTKIQNNDVLRIDKEPILSRFPKVGNIEKCFWKADVKNKSSRNSVPAPSSYWMKGYVLLNKVDFEKMRKEYKWSEVEQDWSPSLDESILKINSLKWFYSDEFNNYVKSADYFGKFYMDIDNGVIYFDIEK